MSKKLTAQSLLSVFPPSLAADKDLYALAAAISDEIETLYLQNTLLAIYTNISSLPEGLLDIFAKDFKVDWYLSDASVESKRAQILSSFAVHRSLGTKAAMETALRTVFQDAKIEEWTEYDGSPYHFRLHVTIPESGVTKEQQYLALEKIKFSKNARSYLEQTDLIHETTAASLYTPAYTGAASYVEIFPGA